MRAIDGDGVGDATRRRRCGDDARCGGGATVRGVETRARAGMGANVRERDVPAARGDSVSVAVADDDARRDRELEKGGGRSSGDRGHSGGGADG